MINKLSDVQIRKAVHPSTKSLSDGKGLSIEIMPKAKRFKFRYQRPVNKKINNLVLGYYPSMSLKAAREIAQQYRELLKKGIDPKYQTSSEKVDFDHIIQLYLKKGKADWSEKHFNTTKGRYENFLKNPFGNRDAAQITSFDIYNLLESVAQSGSYGTAEKLSYIISGAYSQAAILGMVKFNPAAGVMKQVTKTKKTQQMPHFNLTRKGESERLGRFLNDIKALNKTNIAVKTALLLSPLLFMRSGSLASLKLESYDKDNKWLLINAEDMKKDHSDFIVPLSTQAINLLETLIAATKPKIYVFESRASKLGHIRIEAINKAKSRSGWRFDDVTIHGLRHTATTYLTEIGFDYEVTEMQLHHKLVGVRGIYNKAMNRH